MDLPPFEISEISNTDEANVTLNSREWAAISELIIAALEISLHCPDNASVFITRVVNTHVRHEVDLALIGQQITFANILGREE